MILMGLRSAAVPISHLQTTSHARGTTDNDTETHAYNDRPVRGPVPHPNFNQNEAYYIGPEQIYPPQQPNHTRQAQTDQHFEWANSSPPIQNTIEAPLSTPQPQCDTRSSRFSEPKPNSPPRPGTFYRHPARGGSPALGVRALGSPARTRGAQRAPPFEPPQPRACSPVAHAPRVK